MAMLNGDLWRANFAQVRIVDVSDDYLLMQPALPSDFYPVLGDCWLPKSRLGDLLPMAPLLEGYLYDWHESPPDGDGLWYVGVVQHDLSIAAN